MESACRIYRPRDPRKTALWGLLDTLYERVKGSWEERFERKYGFWRGLADEAVARYLDCGIWDNGFAPPLPEAQAGADVDQGVVGAAGARETPG